MKESNNSGKQLLQNIKSKLSSKYKDLENMIRKEFIKNDTITAKEISTSTGISLYTVNKLYMKIKRENSRKVK